MSLANQARILSCRIECNYDPMMPTAIALSKLLQCPLNKSGAESIVLLASDDKWSIIFNNSSPMWVDFNKPQGRQAIRSLAQEPLIKAIKPRQDMQILDLTAGFGRDSALLLAAGVKHITLLEQEPIMQVLLEDGIRRAHLDHDMKLELVKTDALSYLKSLSYNNYPDVIYFDPMHPERIKSAKVKKWMQCLQSWIVPNTNDLEIINLARQRVRERVVVKWPSNLKPLALNHNYIVKTKLIQFINYLPL